MPSAGSAQSVAGQAVTPATSTDVSSTGTIGADVVPESSSDVSSTGTIGTDVVPESSSDTTAAAGLISLVALGGSDAVVCEGGHCWVPPASS